MFLPLWQPTCLLYAGQKASIFREVYNGKIEVINMMAVEKLGKNGNFGVRQTWDQILTSLFPDCVILSKPLTSSGSQFTHLKNGDLCLSLKVVLRVK